MRNDAASLPAPAQHMTPLSEALKAASRLPALLHNEKLQELVGDDGEPERVSLFSTKEKNLCCNASTRLTRDNTDLIILASDSDPQCYVKI